MTFTQLTDPEIIKTPKPDAKKLLYVAPVMDRNGLWHQLMPAAAISRHPAWQVMVTQIITPTGVPYNTLAIEMEEDWVRWADYIIFPFTSQNLAGTFAECKAIKPSIRCCYHLDYHYSLLAAAKHHPAHVFYSMERDSAIKNIDLNVKHADIVFVYDRILYKLLTDMGSKPVNLIMGVDEPSIAYELTELRPKKRGCLRVAVSGDPDALQHRDSNMGDVLQYITKKFRGSEIIFIDDMQLPPVTETDKPDKPDKKKTKKGAKSAKNSAPLLPPGVIADPLRLDTRFREVHALQADLVLIPSVGSDFAQTAEGYSRWLEFARIGVPAIVHNLHFYESLMKETRDHGIRCSTHRDWLRAIDEMADPGARKTMGALAQDYVKQYFTFNDATLKYFEKVFI